MELQIADSQKTYVASDLVFAIRFNESLVHQVITSRMTNDRSGTKGQKNRSNVRGGGIKPWRQKGTGRARAGTIRSPLWRKGGVVFAAQSKNYDQKINKKMYRNAMKSIISELIRLGRLELVDLFEVESHKTKDFCKKLKKDNLEKKVLIIKETIDKNMHLATRNILTVEICDVMNIDPINLIQNEKIIITVGAFKKLEEILS